MKKRTKSEYDTKIEPVIEEIKKNKGFGAEIVRQYEKVTGKDIHAQQVYLWLSADAKRRVEPKFSAATSLFKAIDLARAKRNGE